jgi:hypothetical protein
MLARPVLRIAHVDVDDGCAGLGGFEAFARDLGWGRPERRD